KKVIAGEGDAAAVFHDLDALDEVLGEPELTAAAFILIDKISPDSAKDAYRVAQRSLITTKNFAICDRYLEPAKTYERMVEMLHLDMEYANNSKSAEEKRMRRETFERLFIDEGAALVALLVLNDHRAEAERIAGRLREELNDSTHAAEVDAA